MGQTIQGGIRMSKEEITYKIPNKQIHISEIKDEDCLIWISPKALNMANTIDELQHENQKLKADYGNKAQVERDLLLEENQELKRQLNYLRSGEYYNQLRFERDML